MTRRAWPVFLAPFLVTLVVGGWHIGRPSYWRDEAATIAAARLKYPDLLRLLEHNDAVHGLYYAFMHLWIGWSGTSADFVRLPSLAAAALAAGGTGWLGHRLAGFRVGLVAGLFVAFSPTVSRYAQEARSYAIVMMVAVFASHVFLSLLRRRSAGLFAAYGALVALLGLLHMFALLIVVPHALLLYAGHRGLLARAGGDGGDGGDGAERRAPLWRGFAAAVVAALLVDAGLILLAARQSQQVGWVKPPGLVDLRDLLAGFTGSVWLIVPVLAVAAFGAWRAPSGEALWFALAWAVVPAFVLVVVSYADPVYVFRYVLLSVPAWGLLTAYGLVRLRWAGLIAGVLLIALSVPEQIDIRRQDSRQDDLKRVATIIGHNYRAGDAVLYCRRAYRHVSAAYPVLRRLKDVSARRSPSRVGTLNGLDAHSSVIAARLAAVSRVWFLASAPCPLPGNEPDHVRAALIEDSPAFHKVGTWNYKGGFLSLYER